MQKVPNIKKTVCPQILWKIGGGYQTGLKKTTSKAQLGHEGDKSLNESMKHEKYCVKITCQSLREAEEAKQALGLGLSDASEDKSDILFKCVSCRG